MRILFVSSSNSKLGVAPFIKSQGDSLAGNGVHIQYYPLKGKGIRGYLKSILPLRRFLKKNNFDIVHAHYALCGWAAVLAAPRVPVIVSYMGCDVYGDVKENGKRTHRLNILLSKLLQPFVDKIIVKSKNLEDYVYLKKKVQLIPNGVNFEKFRPIDKTQCRQRLKLSREDKLVLFLGDPADPRKNIKLVKQALELVDDPLVKLIAPYPIDHRQVKDYLNAADVLVSTSYLEGSPNVVKEAMACNCPIVATDVGDIKEVVKNTAGCFITSFSANEAAEKIKLALDFGQRTTGRETISHLDEKVIAQKIIKVYKNLIKNQL